MDKGVFIFSLDLELALGHYDAFDRRLFSSDGSRERVAVKRLLCLFEKYSISVTWAVVGNMFSKEYAGEYPEEWIGKFPEFEEMFIASHPLMHGLDVIRMIQDSKTHYEIASHGFTHTKFGEHLMTSEVAQKELRAWKRAASEEGFTGASMVFPQNKIGHLEVIKDEGFICYRGEELMSTWFRLPGIGRVFRRLYYYLVEFSQPISYEPIIDQVSGLVNLPSSRWMFGLNRHFAQLLDAMYWHKARMRGIVKAVQQAAQNNKVIHIWAHPYEFKNERDFERLEYLFENVKSEIDGGRMLSLTMGELASETLGICGTN